MTDVQTALGQVVADNPAAAPVLDRLGLDYCCHGERSLASACTDAGLDPATVAAQLDAIPIDGDRSWVDLEPGRLADHIVEVHHRYLQRELPLLEGLGEKVVSVHGQRHPELSAVRALISELRSDLEPHLAKEEQVLFPTIRALAGGRLPFGFGAVTTPIRTMVLDHDRAGELLARLREVTRDYAVPDDACASYRSLYERLEALEADTHQHIHKENHALFPAALRLAKG